MDDESNILLVVNGLERSGTIWTSRLLSDSLQIACRTRYNNPPFSSMSDDAAIWHFERPGKFMRRIHAYPHAYPYSSSIPMILVMRDPRDVAVSLTYYKAQGRLLNPHEIDNMTKWLVPLWIKFHKEWLADGRLAETVRYEHLLSNPQKEIEWLIISIGLVPNIKQISQAIYDHDFSRIDNPYKGNFGTSGSWKHQIRKEVSDEIWNEYGDDLLKFGYGEEGIIV